MSVIHILSPHVADLIAAGEVVERPASVVKELMENAIDAGARSITVELRGGGMASIRVTDDGCGMSPEDAGCAFLRHATSKLRDERGLEAISTLGFRGEALAAISAVSRIELHTRTRGAAEGTRVALAAGDIEEMSPAGCPEGTSMLVRDLFYNTPARQKFVKSDRAEGSACTAIALRVALGHPEVSVRCIREGEEVFFSPGDGQMSSAVYALLGRDAAAGLLSCSGENDGVRVEGYVSAPHAGRGSRAAQYFFLNGRAFRSATVQSALEQAYKNTLLTGRFPACVLHLTVGFGKVDVNVHPTKSEVKFSEERKVYDAVYYAVLSALSARSERRTAEIRLSPSTQKAVAPKKEFSRPAEQAAVPKKDFYQQMSAAEFRSSGLAERAAKSPRSAAPAQTRMELPQGALLLRDSGGAAYGSSPAVPRPEIPRAASVPTTAPAAPVPASEKTEAAPQSAAPAVTDAPEVPAVRVIGEALDTYIIAEQGGELLLIDKHACHERIIFDRLLAGLGTQMSQTLLAPLSWSPGAAEAELLEENAALLDSFGFALERFGDDGVLLRAVPADCGGDELALLEEITEALRTGRPEDRRETLCHTIACKAAIKAGSRSEDAELAALAVRAAGGEVRYCPHGRPVCVRLTKTELDKQFKRIV